MLSVCGFWCIKKQRNLKLELCGLLKLKENVILLKTTKFAFATELYQTKLVIDFSTGNLADYHLSKVAGHILWLRHYRKCFTTGHFTQYWAETFGNELFLVVIFGLLENNQTGNRPNAILKPMWKNRVS